MATTVKTKTPAWAKVLVVLILVAAAAVGGVLIGKFFGATEERDTQVLRSITREQQVILLTAGITEIKEERENQSFFDLFDIPGSERVLFVRYEVDAKFGIEGEDVEITRTGDNAFRITMPEFVYLGYENPHFETATETNGLLSWTTPSIDKFDFVEEELSEEAIATHIEGFRPVLEAQARTFYKNIVTSIVPDATIDFVFTEAAPSTQ